MEEEGRICKICCYEYNSTSNVARVLICGHTFCSECISKNKSRNAPLACPVCKKKDARPLSQIPKNHELVDLIEESGKARKRPRTPTTPADDMCPIHRQKIAFYCDNEMDYYCSECIEDHKSHRFTFLNKETLGAELDQKFERRCCELQERLAKCEATCTEITNLKTVLDANRTAVTSTLATIRETLLSLVDNAQRVLDDMLATSMTQLSEDFEVCNLEAQRIRDVLKQRSKVAKLRNIEKVKNLQAIKHLATEPLPQLELQTISFALDMSGQGALARLRQEFGLFENVGIPRALYFPPSTSEIQQYDASVNMYSTLSADLVFPRGSRLINTYYGLYLLGGVYNGISTASVSRIDESSGSHFERASMLEPRASHCVVNANGSIFAIGGSCQDKFLRSCERYNLLLNKWRSVGQLNVARSCATGTVFNQEIYVFGGKTTGNRFLNSIEALNLSTLNWKECRVKLPSPVIGVIPINRSNQNILLVGGFDGTYELNTMAIFTNGNRRLEVFKCGEGIDSLESPVVWQDQAYIYNSSGHLQVIDLAA